MNASLNSSNSDEYMDELNWTSDFATPGKLSPNDTSLMDISCSESPVLSSSPTVPITPPSSKWPRQGSLKLFEVPSTPRSLLRRASQSENIAQSNGRGSGIKQHYHTRRASARLNALKRAVNTPSPVSPLHNPFHCSTPITESDISSEQKRRKLNTPHEELDEIKVSLFSKLRRPVPVRVKNQQHQTQRQAKMVLDLNQSRYKKEFREIRQIGQGCFGEVYQCQNKMDKWFYALKRLIKPIAGSVKEASVLREVYAHAVLGRHQHIVQYYSAWAEDKHMIIQNEYCNGGSLGDIIAKYRQTGERALERDLKQILVQVSKGLRYMHSMNLVHLDIKPGNIFISHRQVSDDEEIKGTCYKIGDLGMVTSLSEPKVDDGDARYIPREILDDDYSNLTKADVFSTSLTVYEVASLMKMPLNGQHWHSIRDGNLNKVDNISEDFFNLLIEMINATPSQRPSPAEILKKKFLSPEENKKICELTRKLNEEKFENQRLLRELEKAKDSPLLNVASSRLVGKTFNRSMSIA